MLFIVQSWFMKCSMREQSRIVFLEKLKDCLAICRPTDRHVELKRLLKQSVREIPVDKWSIAMRGAVDRHETETLDFLLKIMPRQARLPVARAARSYAMDRRDPEAVEYLHQQIEWFKKPALVRFVLVCCFKHR